MENQGYPLVIAPASLGPLRRRLGTWMRLDRGALSDSLTQQWWALIEGSDTLNSPSREGWRKSATPPGRRS